MDPEELAKRTGGAVENARPSITADELAAKTGGQVVSRIGEPAEQVDPITSLVRSVASPVLKAHATVVQGGAALLAKAVGGDEKASRAIDIARKGIDYGYFGTVKPIGAESQEALIRGDITYEDALRKNMLDLAGTSLEVASLAYAPLKLGTGSILTAPLRYTKAVSPFAAPFAAGVGLQAAAQPEVEDEISTGIKQAGGAFVGALAGYGLLNKGGQALSWVGGRFMKSQTGVKLAEKLSESASKLGDYVNSIQRKTLGDELGFEYRALENSVMNTQEGIVNDALNKYYADTYIDEPILLETIKGNYSKIARQYYDARDEFFNKALDGVPEDLRVEMAPIQAANQKIADYLDSKVYSLKGGKLAEAMTSNDTLNLQAVLNLNAADLTPREAYNLFRSLPNYRSENPEIDALIRDKMFSYLESIRNTLSTKAPANMDEFNRAFNYADQVRRNVDDPLVHRMRTAGSAANIVDTVMSGGTPSREQMRVFMEGFTSAEERQNYSTLIYNAIINKARNESSLQDTGIVLTDSIRWIKNARTTSGNTVLTPDHLASLEMMSNLAKSDFETFLRQAQEVGRGAEMTDDVALAIEQITDLNRVKRIADSTNNFREYSILGDEIGKIRSVETLQALLKLIPDNQPELKNTLGREVVRGIFQRHTKNIVNKNGEIDAQALDTMVSGILNDIDRIGGPNKQEIFNDLFSGVTVKMGDQEINLGQYLLSVDDALLAIQQQGVRSGVNVVSATHLITGLFYAFTGRSVPAIYHVSQFSKAGQYAKSSSKAYDDAVSKIKEEGTLRKNSLKKLGDFMQKTAQETRYPTILGGYTVETIMSAAEEMYGRPLTPEEREEIVRKFREGN